MTGCTGVCSSKDRYRQGLRGTQVHSCVGFMHLRTNSCHDAVELSLVSGPAPRASRATPSLLADTVRSNVPTGLLACVNEAGCACSHKSA